MKRINFQSPLRDNASANRLIVGMTGASGAILGIRLLQALKPLDVQTHLVISESAPLTIQQETSWRLEDVRSLADVNYDIHELDSTIASGSYATIGMIIIPCSIKTLSAVANSYSDDLIARAADVTLKEGRRLLLVVRETPYHMGHLRLMSAASQAGAIIYPPIPAFYNQPKTLDEIIDNIVGRVLDRIGIKNDLFREWQGMDKPPES